MSVDRSEAWRTLAACAGLGPSLFYSEHPADVAAAKSLCSSCPVASDCAAVARTNGETFGVWGGEEPSDRRAVPPSVASCVRPAVGGAVRRGESSCSGDRRAPPARRQHRIRLPLPRPSDPARTRREARPEPLPGCVVAEP